MGCVNSTACCVKAPQTPKVSPKLGGDVVVGSESDSTSIGEDEHVDQLSGFTINRDYEVGDARLSRVSSQFLPLEGSKTVRVVDGSYELKYSFLSQRGYYPEALGKANQDSYCIHTPFGGNESDHLFGVFDGHGEFGAQCSQFVKRKLCENLLNDAQMHTDAAEACHSTYLMTNTQLHSDSLDDTMSGTTAVTVLVRGTTLFVANCGDSRAVIAERRGKELIAVDLSVDQTPFREDELERVKNCGARVLTLDQIEGLKNPDVQCWGSEEDDDGDPPRLWVPNGMFPGTAFTRSIGDSIAESIGVVADPEITIFELTPDHPFFVVASDGVFEFISSQTVVDMVAKYKDPREACAAIVAESYRRWLQYETRTDDITIIVVHINGIKNKDVTGASEEAAIKPMSQNIEVTGWSSKSPRVKHDLSRAQVRAIESSMENGRAWGPPFQPHRKSWEEEAHIERVLHDHFLFRKLSEPQRHILLECMKRVEVEPGDVVVKQGGEGDCFYVVGTGEFEVFATREGNSEDKGEPRVLLRYTAEKLSCFGELALMHNKPLQASVRAVTGGSLWALKREDFRGVLTSEVSNLSSLKLLRSINFLSKLTITQVSHVVDSLEEVKFSDGQTIISKDSSLSALYIVRKGQVHLSFDWSILDNPDCGSLHIENIEQSQGISECHINKKEGGYFGEWSLLGEKIGSLTAVAVGDVVCEAITKDKFDSAVGPALKLPQEQIGEQHVSSPLKSLTDIDMKSFPKILFSDMDWRTTVYSTDCSEIGLVSCKFSEKLLSLKRYSKHRVKLLGRETQVLKEKDIMKKLSSSACIPRVLCSCSDQKFVGLLINSCLTCTLSSIIHVPLDELSARFCAASVVIALEQLHKTGVLYRGISPDILMLDHSGQLQLVDFRFAKLLDSERTFTICGMADSLAPEIIQGKGHSVAADWWALGVLIYFMLQAEMPFGSWRESELETFAKIAKGQVSLPQTFSPDLVDLITKLLDIDPSSRLGSQGADEIKYHQWFNGVDWDGIKDGRCPVPPEITSRLQHYIETHAEDCSLPELSPPEEGSDQNDDDWLDW